MDRLPSASALSRALLALWRSRSTGVLTILAGRRFARVGIVEGTPRALSSSEADTDSLGDLLLREGSLDPSRHAARHESDPPNGPIGAWLISHGLATRAAVTQALRVQLRRRVVRVFRWHDLELAYREGDSDIGLDCIDEPVSAADLVLSAMRDVVRADPITLVHRRLGHGSLVLTPLGAELVRHAALLPEEAAMIPLLERGTTVAAALGAAGGSARACRALEAFRVLGAVAMPSPAASYRLLLRKHRQVQNAEEATSLLDLPRGASPTSARRALRRLARDLHPDRFGPIENPAVRTASSEVLKALVRAEAHLRAR